MRRTPLFRSKLLIACRRFSADESGATAVEYALLASGIAVAIAATVFNVGTGVQGKYNSVSTALK